MPHHKASCKKATLAEKRKSLALFSPAVFKKQLLPTLKQQSPKSPGKSNPFYVQGTTVGIYGAPKTLILFP